MIAQETMEIDRVSNSSNDITQKKQTLAVKGESQGDVAFKVIQNDETDESMLLLTGLKNIFQKQLPKMPKEYISRLAYDRNHVAMTVVRHPHSVLGGFVVSGFSDERDNDKTFSIEELCRDCVLCSCIDRASQGQPCT